MKGIDIQSKWAGRFFLLHCVLLVLVFLLQYIGGRPLYNFIIYLFLSGFLAFSSLTLIRNNSIYDICNRKFTSSLYFYTTYSIVIWGLAVILNEHAFQKSVLVSNLPSVLLFFCIPALMNENTLRQILNLSIKIWLPIAVILSYLQLNEIVFIDYQEFFYFQIAFLILPFTKKKIAIPLFVYFIYFVLQSTEARGFMLLFLSSVVFYVIFKMNNVSKKTLNYGCKALIFLPFFFVFTAEFLDFNIIEMSTQGTEETDTRTFLYQEVWNHIEKHKAYLFGTPGLGYETSLKNVEMMNMNTGELISYYEELRYGRLSAEAGILNIMLQGGIVGIIAMVLLYLTTINNVFRNTNNRFCIYVCTLLSFRFAFMFIDGVLTYYMQTLVLMIFFAICNSKKLLAMNDAEISEYFKLPKLSI